MGRRPPEEIIQANKRLILTTNEEIKKDSEGTRAAKLSSNGMVSKSIAKEYLRLNNTDGARKWFTESARYYLESKKIRTQLENQQFTPSMSLQMLNSSILSGDDELTHNVVESIANNPPKYSDGPSDIVVKEVELYAGLWFGNNIELEEENFTKLHNKYGKRLSGYMTSTLEIIIGLAKNSKETFLKGVNDYLQRFPRGGAYKELKYSLDIPMYLILARKRGMDIDPERDIDKKYHKYIPMGLLK